ncbi:MAG: hypothetical protein ACJAYA_000177 [Bacteroidia bacterium]|jgi:hypothetical protein
MLQNGLTGYLKNIDWRNETRLSELPWHEVKIIKDTTKNL